MIDWLKREPHEAPTVTVNGRLLPVIIRRLANARRMTLRLAPDGSEVRISIPRWGRTDEAVDFARSRTDWLESQSASLPMAEPLRHGSRIPYRGSLLEIAHLPDTRRKPRLENETLLIGGASESLAPRLKRWLEGEARELCSADLSDFCARARQAVPRLSLSNARRRWGSCSAAGWIRINWRLVMAPDHVRRSVVAHEVAHLVHLDHSPRFHAFLGELYEGDINLANAWLKREGRSLYVPFG